MGRPKDVAARARALEAVRLRVDGLTYEDIAEALGYSGRASAYNAVRDVLERQEAEDVGTLRQVAGDRLELVIAEAHTILTETTTTTEMTDDGPTEVETPVHPVSERMAATRAIIRAQDSLNRLHGLNVDPADVGTRTASTLLIVESDTLSNNMAAVLAPDMPRPDLGGIIDVEVDDE